MNKNWPKDASQMSSFDDVQDDQSVMSTSSDSGSSETSCRPTFYMSTDLLNAIEEQCAVEGNKKRSPFLAELLALLLTSSIGQKLRDNAYKHRIDLIHELERNLILFNEHIPTERIEELAEISQRHPDQMLVRLVLLGLRVYEQGHARMEAEIKGSSGLPE